VRCTHTMSIILVSSILLVGIVCIVLGYYLRHLVAFARKGSIELEVADVLLRARTEAAEIKEKAQREIVQAENKAKSILDDARDEEKKLYADSKRNSERLIKKEELLDGRQRDIDIEVSALKERAEEVRTIREKVIVQKDEVARELETLAGFSRLEARELLLLQVEKQCEEDLYSRTLKLEREGEARLDRRAKEILVASIHRLGNATVSDTLVTSVAIPSEDIKGKIIGKEGRNIKVFERAAGVELVIDDTPGIITISCFDPTRRQIARVALENLIADGRIQPVKIEEAVQKAEKEINQILRKKGEEAIYECGLLNIDERLIPLIGRLHFRTSYGQNVLQHSIEMAHIAGVLAYELGADVNIAKAGALLHDIGKAVTHEVQGTHVEIGRRILAKFGVDNRITQAMQAHHEEYPYETVESIIVQVADAISGGRPGARRDTVENYLTRLTELESIASSFAGTDRVYAIQAGRELRVFVSPEIVSDLEAHAMARAIALRIEHEMRYPGEIKVNIIRETRAITFAR
jgi:ribonucrease Y